MTGLIVIDNRQSPGEAADEIRLIATICSEEEMRDRIVFLL